MSLLDLNVMNKPIEEGLFCHFFDNATPLPPAGSEYYVETQDISINYATPTGQLYVRTT
jgi:hypothetical protein